MGEMKHALILQVLGWAQLSSPACSHTKEGDEARSCRKQGRRGLYTGSHALGLLGSAGRGETARQEEVAKGNTV